MNKQHHLAAVVVAAVLAFGLYACSSMPKVTRVGVEEQIDISGNWNDTDSRLVAEEMIKDALARPWVDDFRDNNKERPRVIVGNVANKSHEHINTETFVNDLQRELTNSGRVKFVASKEQRDEIRAEREDQTENARQGTANPKGQEYGADFMLKGQINTIMDEAGKTALRYYQVELEMIDMTTNEKVWIGQQKIKKVVKRPKNKI